MGERRKRRTWSDDEKRSICKQAIVPGISVTQVARRYAMNANMIHTWLKDPRFAPPELEPDEAVEDVSFLEVAISPSEAPIAVTANALSSALPSATRVDITLSDGRRVLIEGPTALSAVLCLVQGLMA